VTETDKGLFIQWIDDSPEALRRRDAVKRKERQDKGDEEREQRLIQEQIERAKAREAEIERRIEERPLSERKEGEKISLNLFGKKPIAPEPVQDTTAPEPLLQLGTSTAISSEVPSESQTPVPETAPAQPEAPVKLAFSSKPKNVFSAGKKNPFASKKPAFMEQAKKMSEAERIMREEMELKKQQQERGSGGGKRMRFS
jgi:DNA/RNA-binding protein KIN17